MSDPTPSPEAPKPPRKPRTKTLAVRQKRPQRVVLKKVEPDPVDAIHEAVHHVGKAVRACKAVYDLAKPVIERMRGKK